MAENFLTIFAKNENQSANITAGICYNKKKSPPPEHPCSHWMYSGSILCKRVFFIMNLTGHIHFQSTHIAHLLVRLAIYFAGLLSVSLGIVLCVRCGYGISPISSIPYVLELVVPLSFGTLTMLFHLLNSLVQYILERKLLNLKIFLQIPVAVAFGITTDWLKALVVFETPNLPLQCGALILSVFFTALGMVLMIDMQLVQNPPDGTVRLISELKKADMGKVKIAYDVICVALSLLIGLLFLHRIVGFGVATLVSAIFVGRTLSVLQRHIGKHLINMVARFAGNVPAKDDSTQAHPAENAPAAQDAAPQK